MQKRRMCLAKIRSVYPTLSNTEKRIGDFILKDPMRIVHLPIQELSKKSEVAESTIVKFCRNLGYEGYTDFKIALAQDIVLQEEYVHEDIEVEKGISEITRKVFNATVNSLSDSLKVLDPEEMEKAVDSIIGARKVIFYGVGTSAPIAEEACHRFLYIGIPCIFSPDPHLQVALGLTLNQEDVGIVISHSGITEDTLRAIKVAKEHKAKIICITNYPDSPIAKLSDIKLITSFREINFRIASMAARVVQLTIVDALYVNIALKTQEKALAHINKLKHLLR